MKIKLEKRYLQIGFTIFLTALAILIVYFVIKDINSIKGWFTNFNKIMRPIIFGLIFAYLMTPMLNTIEKRWLTPVFFKLGWFKKKANRARHIRHISIVVTLTIVLFIFYLFFSAVIPEIYKSITRIISSYSTYTENLNNWINKVTKDNPDVAKVLSSFISSASEETDNLLNDQILPAVQALLMPNIKDWLLSLTTNIFNIVKTIWNIFIGIIISIYVLNGKEKVALHATRLTYAFFDTKFANKFIDSMRYVHRTFIGFLSGKVIDSVIIGFLCYFCCLLMKMPYASLISLIVGVTNIIPFVGPFIGAAPSFVLILMVEPKKAFWFLLFIFVLQQFDGNVIGPMILSGSTGLNSFWIIFAITLFGGLYGFVGMIVAVPIWAVVITAVRSIANKRLDNKALPKELEIYQSVAEITSEGEFKHLKPETKRQQKAARKKKLTYRVFASIGLFFKKIGLFIWETLKIMGYGIKKFFHKLVRTTRSKVGLENPPEDIPVDEIMNELSDRNNKEATIVKIKEAEED